MTVVTGSDAGRDSGVTIALLLVNLSVLMTPMSGGALTPVAKSTVSPKLNRPV